jgi:inosine-uridine nucleoside N-ribohydrolase
LKWKIPRSKFISYFRDRRFVVDTDWGVDDSVALIVALSNLKVDAITAVAGNVEVDLVVKNVSKVLQACDVRVPIYKGVSQPMLKPLRTAKQFHGQDGLGDNKEIMEMEGYTDWIEEKKHAALFLIEKAKKSNFNIICLGPLTNIALACCLYPKFPQKINNIYIMGGTYLGKGNAEFNWEYNFLADPESAHKIFKCFKNIHLVPWEASPDFKIPEKYYEIIKNLDTPKGKFYRDSHSFQYGRLNKYMLCDDFTPMVAIDPNIWEDVNELEGKVYTQGDAAGQVSYGWPSYTPKYNKETVNCKVYHKFKVEETMDILISSLK